MMIIDYKRIVFPMLTVINLITFFYIFHFRGNNPTLLPTHQIQGLMNVDSYVLIGNRLYLSSEKSVYSYDLTTRAVELFKDYDEDGVIVGLNNNLLQICTYSNFTIDDSSEDSTALHIFTKDTANTYRFKEMVKPISCNEDIFLIDNYPGSPERKYRLDEGKLAILEYFDSNITQIKIEDENNKTLLTHDNGNLYLIDHSNIYQDAIIYKEWIVLKDEDGYLWVSEK